MYVFLVIKYPYFTYRVDVEDRWRRTESSYYKTKNNTSSRTVLVNRSAETGDLCPLWPPGLGMCVFYVSQDNSPTIIICGPRV